VYVRRSSRKGRDVVCRGVGWVWVIDTSRYSRWDQGVETNARKGRRDRRERHRSSRPLGRGRGKTNFCISDPPFQSITSLVPGDKDGEKVNSQVPSGDSEGGSESSNSEGGDLDGQEGPVVYRGGDGLLAVDTSFP